MRRKASFLLISEVLNDMSMLTGPEEQVMFQLAMPDHVRNMLTAQAYALQKQVMANRADAMNKILQGRRICPLFMHTPVFHSFMQREYAALKNLAGLFARSGPNRFDAISDALSEFAQRYLAVTNRRPAHLKRNQSVTCFDQVTFTDCSVGVCVFDAITHAGMSEGTLCDEHYGEKFPAIFLNANTLLHPNADPAQGTDFDRYAITGFEHCSIPEKQAIIFLLDLFYELGDLEVRVAIDKGKTSLVPAESSLAFATEDDMNFKGLARFGDLFNESRIESDDQRSPLISNAENLRPLVLAYQEAHGQPLLTDPELEKWVCNPGFPYDIAALHNPDVRMWMMGVDFAKQALLQSAAFKPQRNRF